MNVLMVDIGGTNVKVMPLTTVRCAGCLRDNAYCSEMVRGCLRLPQTGIQSRLAWLAMPWSSTQARTEPSNLGNGWVGF